jgi:hypothetical protein
MSGVANEIQQVETRIGPGEELVTLTQATGLLPLINRKKIPVTTMWRWCRVGLRGAQPEYVRVGRRICTTHEALPRFFAALANLDRRNRYQPPGGLGRRPITSRPLLALPVGRGRVPSASITAWVKNSACCS